MNFWTKWKCAKFVDNIEKKHNVFVDLKQYKDMINAFKVINMTFNNENYIKVSLLDWDKSILIFQLPIYKNTLKINLNNTIGCLYHGRKQSISKSKIQQMLIEEQKQKYQKF